MRQSLLNKNITISSEIKNSCPCNNAGTGDIIILRCHPA